MNRQLGISFPFTKLTEIGATENRTNSSNLIRLELQFNVTISTCKYHGFIFRIKESISYTANRLAPAAVNMVGSDRNFISEKVEYSAIYQYISFELP
ncbi:hypothetical protein RRG08_013337 [Elysia crispata]|uniref:Uncharacterized protein n=1 Tax=Elysia crispata TaxID=231223 RepID=A0AAE1B065_9GAST|nr:hypothetical protein RRG08_013337 [Elysia crispata]